jgi:hypothetical protein
MVKRSDSVQVGFRVKKEVYEILRSDSDIRGVSVGSYLAMLITDKHIQNESMRLVSAIPDEKLKQMIADSFKGDFSL